MSDKKSNKGDNNSTGDGWFSSLYSTAGFVADKTSKGARVVYDGAKWTIGGAVDGAVTVKNSLKSASLNPISKVNDEARKIGSVVRPTVSVIFGLCISVPAMKYLGASKRASLGLFLTSSIGLYVFASR